MRQLTLAAILLGIALAVLRTGAQAAPLPPVEPDQAGFSIDGLKRIDDFFDREIKQNRVPGAVVAIAAAISSRWMDDRVTFSLAPRRR